VKLAVALLVVGLSGGAEARKPSMPSVVILTPKVTGQLDPNIVRRYLMRNRNKFQYCYEKHLASNPLLEGKLEAAWEIRPDGKVINAGTMGLDGEVAACAKRVLESIEYPKPRNKKGVAVNVVFVMKR
jgi:hypothetical protein